MVISTGNSVPSLRSAVISMRRSRSGPVPSRQKPCEAHLMGSAQVFGNDHLGDRAPERLVARNPEHARRARVPVRDATPLVKPDHGAVRPIQHEFGQRGCHRRII